MQGTSLQGTQSSPSISEAPQPDQRLHWCTPRDPLRSVCIPTSAMIDCPSDTPRWALAAAAELSKQAGLNSVYGSHECPVVSLSQDALYIQIRGCTLCASACQRVMAS